MGLSRLWYAAITLCEVCARATVGFEYCFGAALTLCEVRARATVRFEYCFGAALRFVRALLWAGFEFCSGWGYTRRCVRGRGFRQLIALVVVKYKIRGALAGWFCDWWVLGHAGIKSKAYSLWWLQVQGPKPGTNHPGCKT